MMPDVLHARCARGPALKRSVNLRVSDTHGFAARTPDSKSGASTQNRSLATGRNSQLVLCACGLVLPGIVSGLVVLY